MIHHSPVRVDVGYEANGGVRRAFFAVRHPRWVIGAVDRPRTRVARSLAAGATGVVRPLCPVRFACFSGQEFVLARTGGEHITRTMREQAAFSVALWYPNSLEELERVKGIGPSTRSLGSYCSTTELHPHRQGR